MYEIDPKFLNEDGSINTDAACAAGRKAQARTTVAGAGEIKVFAKRFFATAVSAFGPKASPRNG